MINDPNYIPYTKSVGEAERGTGVYDFAKNTPLDAKCPILGGCATIGLGTDAFTPITTADTTNSDTTLNVTASTENLSAKYKYPQTSQDTVPQNKVAKPGSNI